ncbi:MAG: trehalose-phosphatase [Candidatus Omnitrophica bacterium]|nr:trehalose-phosphatase [Candidatus Omnitrophota bacterium]MDD5771621.1 trehalose-phosphatase [Candidatus Omnitrophota bacterium]
MRHIFNALKEIKGKLKGRPLFIFLDCDGTLAPIADTPEKAAVPEGTKRVLSLLSKKDDYRVAVISGRELRDIKKKIGLKKIIYSGNHGFQITAPGFSYSLPVPSGYRNALRQIKSALRLGLSGIGGVLIEDKGFFLSLHFRLAKTGKTPLIKSVFRDSVAFALKKGKVTVRPGKKVFEIGPPVRWNKGRIVLWTLARREFNPGRNKSLPIYIGDDITDEDAFRVLKGRGLTVFVGRPGASAADYYLKDTREVARFLRLLSDWGSASRCRN